MAKLWLIPRATPPVAPLVGVALGLMLLSTAVAQTSDPDWNTKPSEADVERFYPGAARRLGKEGHVVLHCGVSAQGRAHDCSIVEETPKGFGFGDAAVSVMSLAVFHPATEMGHPIEAKRPISVPIEFKMSGSTLDDLKEGLAFGALLLFGFGIQVFRAFAYGVVSGRSGGESQRKKNPALFWFGTVTYTFVSALGLAVILTTLGVPIWISFPLGAAVAVLAIFTIWKKPV